MFSSFCQLQGSLLRSKESRILSDDGMKFPVTEEQKGSRHVVQRRGSQSIYVLQPKWNRGEDRLTSH